MSEAINKHPLTHDPKLEALLQQAKKITMTAAQERAQTKSLVVGQMLISNPHLTRDYVTGMVDMVLAEQEKAAARNEVDIFLHEVGEEIARARQKFPGKNLTTIALVEEVGELAKAVLGEPVSSVRQEAIQVATMAARIVLDGDCSTTDYRREKHQLGPIK